LRRSGCFPAGGKLCSPLRLLLLPADPSFGFSKVPFSPRGPCPPSGVFLFFSDAPVSPAGLFRARPAPPPPKTDAAPLPSVDPPPPPLRFSKAEALPLPFWPAAAPQLRTWLTLFGPAGIYSFLVERDYFLVSWPCAFFFFWSIAFLRAPWEVVFRLLLLPDSLFGERLGFRFPGCVPAAVFWLLLARWGACFLGPWGSSFFFFFFVFFQSVHSRSLAILDDPLFNEASGPDSQAAVVPSLPCPSRESAGTRGRPAFRFTPELPVFVDAPPCDPFRPGKQGLSIVSSFWERACSTFF